MVLVCWTTTHVVGFLGVSPIATRIHVRAKVDPEDEEMEKQPPKPLDIKVPEALETLPDDADPMSVVTKEWMMEVLQKVEPEDLEESDPIDVDSLPELEDDPEELAIEAEHERIEAGLQSVSEWMGEFDGIDEPLDVWWRKEADTIVRSSIASAFQNLDVVDVMWDYQVLRVTVDTENGVTSDQIDQVTKTVIQALELHDDRLDILPRFGIEVTSPGAPDVLNTQQGFDAFKGHDVDVFTLNPIEPEKTRTLSGKLVEKNQLDVVISQYIKVSNQYATVKIPYHLVDEVRLAPPKLEHGPLL